MFSEQVLDNSPRAAAKKLAPRYFESSDPFIDLEFPANCDKLRKFFSCGSSRAESFLAHNPLIAGNISLEPQKPIEPPLGRGEYFRAGHDGPSPTGALCGEIVECFSKKNASGALSRAALGLLPIAGFCAGSSLEAIGTLAAIVSVTTIPLMPFSLTGLGGMLAIGAAGWATFGLGLAAKYLSDRASHSIRRIFGDTEAAWSESLCKNRYPVKSPDRYI
jgi:hypothetical protein